MIAISLMWWEDTKTVRPSAARPFSRVRIQSIPSGSRPLDGSSNTSVEQFVREASSNVVRVRTPDASRLMEALTADGVRVSIDGRPDVLQVAGLSAEQVGQTALTNQVLLYELTPEKASLEEAFMRMTRDAVEFEGRATRADRTDAGAHA